MRRGGRFSVMYWKGGLVHTRTGGTAGCGDAGEPRPAAIPLRIFNMLWWEGRVCRGCVPGPVLSEAAAAKVPWPWRGYTG